MKNKIYIVKYSTGCYDDFREHDVFITKDRKKAEKYVKKITELVKKVKAHYEYLHEKYGYYSDEFYKNVCLDRFYTFADFNNAYFREIDLR